MDTDDSSPISNDSSKKRSSSSRQKSNGLLDNGMERSDDDAAAIKIKKKKKKRRSSSLAEGGGELDNGASDVEVTATTTAADGTKKVKKKKSKQREKRRSSMEESSDGNSTANGNGGDGMQKSSSVNSLINEVDFASSSSSGGNKMEGDKLRDSLTLSKEPKKMMMGGGSGGGGNSRRASGGNTNDDSPSTPSRKSLVQFTASTLQRDSSRLLSKVMGDDDSYDTEEEEEEASASGGGGGVGLGDATSIKSTGSAASSGGSALKKQSKYNSGPKKATFDMSGEEDEATKKDATDSTTSTRRGRFDLRPSFNLNDDNTPPNNNNNSNNNNAQPTNQRRKSRKEMFARAARNDDDQGSNNNKVSNFKDTRRGSAPPEFSRPQDDLFSDDDNDDEPKPPKRSSSMNELNPRPEFNSRPAISRRSSCKSIRMIEQDEDEEDITSSSRLRLHRTKTAIRSLTTTHRKDLRRVRMSMEKQIYIPPKNRNRGIFSALGKLLAGRVVEVVLWTYQAGFGKVMLFFLTFYVVNIFFWAAIMDAVDRSTGGRCVHDESFDASAYTNLERYEFMFELAWTTFTTVGYGAIGPAPDIPRCYPIRLVCAFVAFTGVLFGSTTAAIMYSKLMRLLAKAHVTFSSTLCVQFGKGNESSTVRFGQFNFRASVAPAMAMKAISMEDLLDDSDNDGDKREDPLSTSEEGFPVIEFRMVNDRANQEGSEIWDAQIRGIIQLEKDINPTKTPNANATGGESTLDLDKKAYYQFALTPDSHPHFSRIWYARHVLNAESPLLKREIRDMIVQEGGKWDKDFNTASEIRQCLNEFISLRITLSGTSAVSANTVFAEHVYEYEDVVVGWRFANMVYEKELRSRRWKRLFRFGRGSGEAAEVNGKSETFTKVDKALIHDIVPQPGDDYEDLAETSALSQLGGLFKRRN